MSAEKLDNLVEVVPSDAEAVPAKRAPYEPPRIEKRRSVARVTLMSGMAQMGVGLTGMMM